MHEARFYRKLNDEIVLCELCPHGCRIVEGKTGICGVRTAERSRLYTKTYGKLSAIAIDPVEKKPLYHFYPGSKILSIGSIGCTMHCDFCQNSDISQCKDFKRGKNGDYSVPDIQKMLTENSLKLIAFTYNEPVVFYEFILDIAKAVTQNGVECVMVTNGYINQAALKELNHYISAYNIDLKSYSDRFYKKYTGANLKPVIQAIELVKRSNKHLEITYLVIPGLNDDPEKFFKLVKFISKNFGRSQVLHISRYFPKFKMNLAATPLSTMKDLIAIAKTELHYVYPGNSGSEFDSNTYCGGCGSTLIKRENYSSKIVGIHNNQCTSCGKEINVKTESDETNSSL